MAKDAKGHGSEAGRGGGSYPNIDKSAFRKNSDGTKQHVGYGGGTFRISKDGAGGYHATEQNGGGYFHGNNLGHISQQLTDRAAAAMLAGDHPKSAPVPVHSGASGPSAENRAWNEFHQSYRKIGPHFLDPHDPRAKR